MPTDALEYVCELADEMCSLGAGEANLERFEKLLLDTYEDVIIENSGLDQVIDFMDHITYENAKIVFSGDEILEEKLKYKPLGPSKKEEYMNTKYRRFQKPKLDSKQGCEKGKLELPTTNPMIPDDFRIYGLGAAQKANSREPKLLSENNFELWFLQDTLFKMPRVVVNLIFYIPDILNTPLKAVQNDVFIELL